MSDARTEQPPGLPWTVRLFESVPIAPVWIGILIALSWLAVYVGYAYQVEWIGGSAQQPWHHFELAVLCAAMFGYLQTTTTYGFRESARDLQALRPALDRSDSEFRELLHGLTRFDGGRLLIVSTAAAVFGLLGPLSPSVWSSGRTPEFGDAELTWNMLEFMILSWLGVRDFYMGSVLDRRISKIGASCRVEILDTRPLAPLGRAGLRGARVTIGFTALMSLMLLLRLIGYYIPLVGIIAFLIASLGLAVFRLLAPMMGVRRRIREAKRTELERVREVIRAESRSRPEREDHWQSVDGHLSDLIVYETRIESVSTWPVDTSGVLRFALYVFGGLGAWVGAALMERLLSAAFS
jgi:hypothetical protein